MVHGNRRNGQRTLRVQDRARDAGRKSPDALKMKKKRMTANAEVGTARRKRRFEKQFAAGKDEEIAFRSVLPRAWMAYESVQVAAAR